MADNAQQLSLDASQFFSEMARIQGALKAHSDTLGDVTNAYVRLNQKDDEIVASFRNINAEGNRITGTMRQIDGVLTPVISKMEKLATTSRAALSGFIQSGADKAKGLLSNIIGTDIPLTPTITNNIKKLQEQIAAQIGRDPGSLSVLQEQIARLRKGDVSVETGSRELQQRLAIQVLAVEQQISREKEKQARLIAQGNDNRTFQTRNPLAAGVDRFSNQLQQMFPVPPNTSLSQFASYTSALNAVIDVARAGKVPLADLQTMLTKLQSNPFQNLGSGGATAQAQAAIQRLLLTYKNLGGEAEKAGTITERVSRSLFIGFSNISRLVQAQVIHRFFGNLITDMQQSIGQAAEFDKKLSEIMTIGSNVQGVGAFRQQIAALSAEFNRSPVDVAEGTYQALSNQVIKTAGDMNFMRAALELSRATMSSTTDSVNALSNVINAYRTGTFDAARVSDMLFRAVDLGRFRLGDLAQNMGRVSVTGQQLGVRLEELLAFMTISTRAGVTESESITMLSGVMTALQRPTQQMSHLLTEWGVSSGEAAISAFGFVGVLQRLRQEAEKGGGRLNELLPNVRGGRGFRAVSNTGEFEAEVSRIQDSQGAAAEASRTVASSIGEQFTSELNKITAFMTAEFGPRILRELLNVGQSFGGFSNLIRQAAAAMAPFAVTALRLAAAITTLLAFLDKLGITIPALVSGITAYTVATKLAGPITVALGAAYEAVTGSATRQATAQTLINTRLSVYAAEARGAAVSQVMLTQAQNASAAASFTLRGALVALSTAFLPFAIITGLTLLISYMTSASTTADDLAKSLAGFEQRQQRMQEDLSRSLSEGRSRFENNSQQIGQAWQAILRPMIQVADRLRDQQREVGRSIHDDLERNIKAAADTISNALRYMEQRAKEATNNIRDSFKKINQERDRTAQTLFNAQSSFLGQGVTTASPFTNWQEAQNAMQVQAAQDAVSTQQRLLIQERIEELQQQALRDAARGDREGIDAARRKYDEIRRLTEQQFQIEIEQQRRGLQLSLQLSPNGGIGSLQIDFRRLRDDLDAVNQREAALERRFQSGQVVVAANAAALAQALRERERLITDSQQRLLQFKLTNDQGDLLERFRGPNGLQTAMQEFDRLAQAAREALLPIRLTQQELERLRTRLGEQQAETLRRALQEGTITPEQVRQLEGSITTARMTELQRQLQNFAVTQQQMRDVERAIAAQRNQIAEQFARERAATELRVLQQRISDEIRMLNERDAAARQALQNAVTDQGRAIGDARRSLAAVIENVNSLSNARIFALPGGAQIAQQRTQVLQLAAAYRQALDAFENNRTEENAARARTALDQLTEAYTRLVRTAVERGIQNVPAGLTLEQFIQQQQALLQGQGASLTNTTAQIAAARTALTAIQREQDAVNQRFAAMGANMNQVAAAATQMGAAIQAGLGPTSDALRQVSLQLAEIARQLNGLRVGGPAVAPPAAQGPVFGPEPPPGFAEGGLIGGVFTGHGPDNRIIAARDGEFIVNSHDSQRFYSQLVAINSGRLPRFADGGMVGGTSSYTEVGDININVDGSSNPDATARAVLSRVRREIRRGNGSF